MHSSQMLDQIKGMKSQKMIRKWLRIAEGRMQKLSQLVPVT